MLWKTMPIGQLNSYYFNIQIIHLIIDVYNPMALSFFKASNSS